jgi:hypothetical protein
VCCVVWGRLEGELKQALAMLQQTKADLDKETRQRIQYVHPSLFFGHRARIELAGYECWSIDLSVSHPCVDL